MLTKEEIDGMSENANLSFEVTGIGRQLRAHSAVKVVATTYTVTRRQPLALPSAPAPMTLYYKADGIGNQSTAHE